MKVTDFTKVVTETEGKKVSISIAQVSEVLKIVNNLVGGKLYTWIRGI